MSRIRRKRRTVPQGSRSDEPTLADQAILLVPQDMLAYKSPDQFGEASYHVRIFRPPHSLPVVVIGDMGNHPVASVTNRFDEIALIVAKGLLGQTQADATQLHTIARWIEHYPEGRFGSSFGESFNEIRFESLSKWPVVSLRPQFLRRPDVEDIAGGPLRAWHAHNYTTRKLARTGARVLRARTR